MFWLSLSGDLVSWREKIGRRIKLKLSKWGLAGKMQLELGILRMIGRAD